MSTYPLIFVNRWLKATRQHFTIGQLCSNLCQMFSIFYVFVIVLNIHCMILHDRCKVNTNISSERILNIVLYFIYLFSFSLVKSLRQAARPDEVRVRRFERTVKLWLLEAKAIPPKKRYYCEILLDDVLYAR